jgi:signal transduction histidine kinase
MGCLEKAGAASKRQVGAIALRQQGSIFFRLIIPLGVTLLFAMLAAWVIAVQLLTNAIDRRLDDQLDHATAVLADGPFPFSLELIRRIDRLIEARIALLDDAGRVQLSTMPEPDDQTLADLAPDIASVTGGQIALTTREIDGVAWRVAVRPLSMARDSRYQYVVAAASLAGSRQAAKDAALLLGTAMLVATFVLAWFGIYFTRSITRPISDLANMADRIADGERDITSEFAAMNEIGLLARALNGMAGRLKQYEEEISRQSHLAGLGDLAARLAHEIRNPLTSIKMQLQLLEESVQQSDADRVRTLLNEIRRMELIVETALTLGAPLELQLSDVQPGAIIEDLADLLTPGLEHKGIDLQTNVLRSAAINADPDRLKQALLNLINNAADELAGGGIIRVTGGPGEDSNTFEISVADSGSGYSPDTGDRARNKPFGLGLGLTISREIVELHGGELIQSTSEELGGAKFTICLHASILDDPGKASG